ncbi:hypothetical protein PHYSODRAFT_506731 [Phytophthora sojae]|uniref:Uncharacterized protein n=1 Tax=Phytophthora sojae (strain P6497) TaxID=1094619 RepID=G4ZPE3_PHYSP|nr:hypothetical protein PHYSODRAFT_506731 [Phytophthora sojae]EGZ15477.1 hypothetical protein PHYSODRAFT_506731 [Phytophthora sojae]|eukprot:XP_009529226.1 hypothetical protein PHYSODRAFT_506731 [Phytophthora sojae]
MDALLVKTKKEVGKGGKLIYLYDGPPIFPPQTAQMVCFTSPNETWFRMMAKNPHKRTLFMPLWDLEELQTAAKALDLAMDTSDTLLNYEEGALSVLDKVEQRYRTFGGVARECLSTVESIIESRQKEMEIFMSYFENVDNLVNFFNRTEAEVVLHGVGHYIPNPEGPGLYTLVVASEFVKQFLTDRWKRLEASTRNKICRELQAISAAASFRGVLFNVHEKTEQQDHSAGP